MMIQFVFHSQANEVLKNETTMFEKFLKRVDPKDIGLQQAGEFCWVFSLAQNIVGNFDVWLSINFVLFLYNLFFVGSFSFLVKIRTKIWQTSEIQMKLPLLKHLRINIRKISVTLHGFCHDSICERQKKIFFLTNLMQCMVLEIMNIYFSVCM